MSAVCVVSCRAVCAVCAGCAVVCADVQEIEDHESVVTNKKQAKRRLCLDDCFRLFCMNEQLGENDQW
jgi:hypothetical protein